MKFKFTFLFLALSVFANAQNWQIINPKYKYNYSKGSDTSLIAASILVDSLMSSGSDTVYFLNRMFTYCDTCTYNHIGATPCDTCFGLDDQPGFLQRRAIKKSNQSIQFQDTGNFVIRLDLNTWVFDSLHNITASIKDSLGQIFNNQDSLKVIVTSNGGRILLSKNYGVFGFYIGKCNYTLIGINGHYGKKLLSVDDFYDFQINDEFEYYHILDGPAYPYGGMTDTYHGKFKVINKTPVNGHFNYLIETHQYHSHNELGNYYSDSYISIDTSCFWKNLKIDFPFQHRIYRQSIGFVTFPDSNTLVNYYPFETNSSPVYERKYDRCKEYYKKSLGLIKRTAQWFENGESYELVAYKTSHGSLGTISPDSYFNGINDGNKSIFKISPNPASTSIKISGLNGNNPTIQVLDILGNKVISNLKIENENMIDVSNLIPGIYFIELTQHNSIYRQKLLISR